MYIFESKLCVIGQGMLLVQLKQWIDDRQKFIRERLSSVEKNN